MDDLLDEHNVDSNIFDEAIEVGGDAAAAQNDEATEVLAELDDTNTASTKKRKTINRGPKLDTRRLLGPRGIPALQSHFEDIKLQGKGHEVDDLDVIMSKLEHWAHRLYPKLMFDDCLEKLETLGRKKEIQVCLKKLRMGMPLMDENMQTTILTTDGPAAPNNDSDVEHIEEEVNIFPDPVAMEMPGDINDF